MNLLGNVADVVVGNPATTYTSNRWPFGAVVYAFDDGTVSGTLSSGGYRVYEIQAAPTTPDAVAAQLDTISKAVFSQMSWYQQP